MPGNRVVINADDFGMCESVNRAIIDSYRNGVLSSTTIIAPAPAFESAAEVWQANPGLGIGVHLTLTSEWKAIHYRPTLPVEEVPSLVDENGFFFSNIFDVLNKAKIEEVYRELKNQIEICRRKGLSVDHLDNHMGVLMIPRFGKIYRSLAQEYRLPVRQGEKMSESLSGIFLSNEMGRRLFHQEQEQVMQSGLPVLNSLATPSWGWTEGEVYGDLLQECRQMFEKELTGKVDFFVHPAADGNEIRTINTDHWPRRVFEYQMLLDPEFRRILEAGNWNTCRYGDLFQFFSADTFFPSR